MRDRIIELRRVRAGDLQPHRLNFRRHPDAQKAAVEGSLATIGQVAPLIAYTRPDGALVLVDGHLRAGISPDEEVTVALTDLREPEADQAVATLDRSAAMAEQDDGLLSDLLASIAQDTAAGLLVHNDGLDGLLKEMVPPPELLTDPDEIPENVETRCKPGDLWRLGDHRLLCGDSTKAEDVARLMSGERAQAMLADPPYGMGERRIRDGCDRSIPNEAAEWDAETFDIRRLPVREHKTLLWGAQYYGGAPSELGLMTWSCWDKQTREMGAVPHGALELCCANFGRSHVWPIMWGPYQSMRQDVDHPTAKPVELIAETVEMATDPGDLIYDPFLGSGTTLIAAEQLGRRAYGMEIEPKYCDIVITRWERATGKTAERVA